MNDFQRTDEWFLQRRGMITASEVADILGKGKKKDDVFSKTALSYLDSKVAERLMDEGQFLWYSQDVKRSNAAMQWGNDYESEARSHYEEATGNTVFNAGFQTLEGFDEFVGGSPDGRLSTLDGIVEFKCPYNPAIHIEHCTWRTPEQLHDGNLQYYAQCQLNMLITHTDYCDFVSYSPLFGDDLELSVLKLPADKEFQTLLCERIELAVAYIAERELLIKNNQ